MKFAYSVKTADGQLDHGVIEAPSENQAAKLLHDKKLFVLDMKADGAQLPGLKKDLTLPFIGRRVSLKDKIIFTQQLAMMVKSGLPLIDAFSSLEEQTNNKYFASVINQLASDVKGGKPLSESLVKNPNIFPELYVAMIRSGEQSGKLDEVLLRLAEQLQKDYDLISKIKAAVSYPIIVVVALIGIVFIMLIFVVPQLKQIFAEMGVELPLITRIVLGLSDILTKYWYIFLILVIGLYSGIRFSLKNPAFKLIYDKTKLRMPLVGPIIKKIYMARFTRTMGTLVASGLPMLDIISTVKSILTNRVYRDALDNVSKDVESGVPLSLTIKKQRIFPPMIYNLIGTGEKSGKLDYVLLSMADFFDKDVESATGSLTTIIEPVLIILIGGGVGLVVASVLMPMYSLVNAI